MYKTLIIMALSIFIIGCGADKHPHAKRTMFQTVSEKDAILVQTTKDKKYCVKCGMDLVKFYKTSHTSQTEDGKTNHQYCSIHCLEDHLGTGTTLKNPKVVAVDTLKLISVADAFYVVGSSKRGTMSRVSKYAFTSEAQAKKFQAVNGGEIMNFTQAREKAQEDFKHYR